MGKTAHHQPDRCDLEAMENNGMDATQQSSSKVATKKGRTKKAIDKNSPGVLKVKRKLDFDDPTGISEAEFERAVEAVERTIAETVDQRRTVLRAGTKRAAVRFVSKFYLF